MPAIASLNPKLIKSRERIGKAPWCITIPPHLSPTSRQQRLFFPIKKAAALESEKLKGRQDNFGISLTALTPARIAKAAEAYNLLQNSGLGLLDVVRNGLSVHRARTSSIPFKELFDQFILAKAHRSKEYQRELGWTRDRFPQLHAKLAVDIAAVELEKILRPLSPGARNPVMRYLRAVFNYGIKRGFLAENPISKLDFVERPRREVEVVPNQYVARMLEHALEEDLALLPFLVFGFFCGIRPDGELQKLDWSDIHLPDRTVVIRSEVSKTRRRRFPDLSENAVAWLAAYHEYGGQMLGKVVTYTDSQLRTHRKANQIAAGLARWVHQGMRHTFCSNWLAVHKDVNKLVLLSGHDSVDTMWRHYHRGTPESEARDFWNIVPRTSAENILPFTETNRSLIRTRQSL
jgi:integrase